MNSSLANLQNQQKESFIFNLATVCIFLLIIIFFDLTPSEAKTTQKLSQDFGKISKQVLPPAFEPIKPTVNATYDGQIETPKLKSVNLPEKAEVFNLTFEPVDGQKAAEIASKLSFLGKYQTVNDATFGPVYFWSKEKASISISKRGISYLNLPEIYPLFENASAQKYDETGRQILEKLNLGYNDLVFRKSEVEFLKVGGQLQKVADAKDAQLVSIRYDFKKNDLPFVGQDLKVSTISLYLTANGELAKMSYQFAPRLESVGQNRLKTTSQAIEEIKKGKGILSQFLADGDGEAPDKLNLTSVTLEKMFLAYYLPRSASALVEPVFVFEGRGVLDNGKGGGAIYYLSALAAR